MTPDYSELFFVPSEPYQEMKQKYQARCDQVFYPLDLERGDLPLPGEGISMFDRYDMDFSRPFDSEASKSAAMDFIIGLRQTRAEANAPLEERMTHKESEVIDSVTNKMESMQLEEEDEKEMGQARFVRKEDRKTKEMRMQLEGLDIDEERPL